MKLSRRVILIIIIFFNFIFSFSEDKIEVYPPYLELEDGMKIPQLPTDDLTEVDLQGNIIGKRVLEKNTTVYLESRVNVFVPLEIISDIDIDDPNNAILLVDGVIKNIDNDLFLEYYLDYKNY